MQPEFVWQPTHCDRCFDIGLRINPQGAVETCPAIQLGDPHPELSPVAKHIVRAVDLLKFRKLVPEAVHFDIARTLARYDAAHPCSARELIDLHFGYALGDVKDEGETRRRLVTKAIHFLRDIWFLPVCSAKEKPAGYWIAVDEADFKAYVGRATREPITTLSTIHRMAKANWPVFAEQLEINFFADVEEVRAAA